MRSGFAFFCLLFGCSSSGSAPASVLDAGAEEGAVCAFNDDCPSEQRCTCSGGDCACRLGVRGTGKAGVDACTSEIDCASGLCVEGTSGFVCSGPCAKGCGPSLPSCAEVPTLGSICVRKPPETTGAKGSFGGKSYAFSAAYFGYESTAGKATGVSLELQAGSDGTCPPPKKDPAGVAVIAGVPAPVVAGAVVAPKVTLLGIDPGLPLHSSATASTVTLSAIEACAPADGNACAFVVDVSLTFAEGTIVGSSRAIHCASMDSTL